MMRTAVVALLFAATDAKAVGRGADAKAQTFLGVKADMRPDVVARSLAKVEDEWNLQVASFVECNTSATSAEEANECGLAPHAFSRSCSTVVNAMVMGSNGDKADVAEYMNNVCGEDALTQEAWRQARCNLLSKAISEGMSDDSYNNRNSFDAAKLCTKFWTKFSSEETARLEKERAEKEALEKKEEEEREAAQKKAEEEEAAKEKAEKEAAEAADKKRKEDEAAAAAEAEKLAKEAEAKKLAEKNEEAARVAAAAEAKLQEAKVATEAATAATATEAAKPEEAAPAEAAQPEEAAPAESAPAEAAPAVLAANATVAENVTANATVATNATNATVNKTA